MIAWAKHVRDNCMSAETRAAARAIICTWDRRGEFAARGELSKALHDYKWTVAEFAIIKQVVETLGADFTDDIPF